MFRLFILTAVFSLGSLMLSNAFGGTSDQTRGEECMAITTELCSGDDAPSGKPGCPVLSSGRGCDSEGSACNRCSGGPVTGPHVCVTRYFSDTASHVCTLDGVKTTRCGDLMTSVCATMSFGCKCNDNGAQFVLVNGQRTACLYQNCK